MGSCPSGKLSWLVIVLVGIVLVGISLGGELSCWGNVLVGSSPGGELPWWRVIQVGVVQCVVVLEPFGCIIGII